MDMEIEASYFWDHEYIFAGSTNKIYLLVQWSACMTPTTRRKSTPKLLARDVELYLWLEPYILVGNIYGCEGMKRSQQQLLIVQLGHLYNGIRQSLVIECTLLSQTPGEKHVLSAQWRYKEGSRGRARQRSVEEIYIHYSYDLGRLRNSGDINVEKHIKLLKTPTVIKEADKWFNLGEADHAEFILRRKGDELLLFAIHSGDPKFIEEAETLYRLSKQYVDAYQGISLD
ncbi:hypothetical protein J2T13_001563 [Paenibacillus sp. DS2015]|uniref:hypothetical protein n=1 Tax=Paenibacillus sp. DS2015 TaxID=3373917 RepID=UPI003D1D0FD9